MQAGVYSCGVGMLLACLLSAGAQAQQPTGMQKEGGVYTLHEDTHLVLLDVTVTGKHGHPVTGLTKDDFKLLEDGQPQTIKFFEEHAPVDPAEIAKEKAAALAAQIEFFDEHIVPVDPAEIARQKAAAIAGQPLNTFTNYEPFTGRPVTVLLLNELFPVLMNHKDLDPAIQEMAQDFLYRQMFEGTMQEWKLDDPRLRRVVRNPLIRQKIMMAINLRGYWDREHKKMLDLVQSAPPDTPFVIYLLDSQLRLAQSITTDRALLQARIDVLWKAPTPQFGSEQMINLARRRYFVPGLQRRPDFASEQVINPMGLSPDADISVRRRIFTDAWQQLASSLEGVQGRKNLYVFTGPFQCSVVAAVVCADMPFPNDNYYLCKWMDALEQGRMSIYRYYGQGNDFAHGFGCSRSVDLGTSANYYTLYYTPTNGNWDGKYRATTVEVADEKGMHLLYRKGYYGTPENAGAHYYAAKKRGGARVAPSSGGAGSGGSTIAASAVAAGTANPQSAGSGATPAPPNPVSSVFTVQVVPAAGTSKDKEYRQLTLHFSMPANEFKVVQTGSGHYVARLLISGVGYADGRVASLDGSKAVQMAVNFNGIADPRIATSTITAEMRLNELEHGTDRWLLLTVRDMATGQMGSLVIPMAQVKVLGTQ